MKAVGESVDSRRATFLGFRLGPGALAVILGAVFALLGFAPAAEAVTVKINLAGGGQGTVKSLTPGIECSNVPDGPSVCEAEFVAILGGLRLEAAAGPRTGNRA